MPNIEYDLLIPPNMKKILLLLILSSVFMLTMGQVPQGFNYQALASDASGNPLKNTSLQVKISILSDTITPVIVWEELHATVQTNDRGVFSVVIGTGTRQSTSTVAAFNNINWSATPVFLKTQIYYQSAWKSMGSAKIWSVPYAMVAGGLGSNFTKLAVAGETSNMEEALFEVKNKNGQTVFAVYNEGVRIYVDDGAKGSKGGFAIGGFATSKAPAQDLLIVNNDSIRAYVDNNAGKGGKGGFAIGGFGKSKAPGDEYLRVTADSTRIYVDNTGTKGSKGGFAIGGFASSKGAGEEYLRVTPDSTRIYLNNSVTKGSKGGFAIGGFGTSKGPGEEYLRVTPDSTRIYLNENTAKGSKGGFAIGSFNGAKGATNDYFLINPDSTRFYLRSVAKGETSTFSIIGIDPLNGQKPLMNASPDTMFIGGVLNLQNNMVVSGNVDITGAIIQDSTKIADVDGNNYRIVKIGTMVWLKDNLKTTKYRDGTPIPRINGITAWDTTLVGAYCWYNNDSTYKNKFGALYNWYSVNNARGLCPTGWHVPADFEFAQLSFLIGGPTVAGGKLKEAGLTHWIAPNTAATDSTGFTALASGYRENGIFADLGKATNFWTNYFADPLNSFTYGLIYNLPDLLFAPKANQNGYSIRCIKDNQQAF
jgi:uncharacterized protein (TIGR02145 family)